VRVIAGNWRGRPIRFPSTTELRPTPDRVRETLFNWLQASVPGAACLDLFAGSGALGLEALSRGAAQVVFVERDRQAAAAVRRTLAEFGATGGSVVEQDAFTFLAGTARAFDVVFLDPPFAQGGLGELCKLLSARGWLAARAFVYIEQAARVAAPELPDGWSGWREMRAGEVCARLVRATPASATGGARVGDT
jgi:16S rRNA (guanine966-N2)-methyltransferase